MKSSSKAAAKVWLALFAVSLALAVPAGAQTPANSSRKPVVVELFTSEGCSSCPPAEAIALQMEKQPLAGIELIVLEEHVDYWNQYGWHDPFSSMEWTDRQQDYVSKVAGRGPYTPEMVVDGESQFVGSNGSKAQQAIERAAQQAQTKVTVSAGQSDPKDSADFNVSVGNLQESAAGDVPEVWLAVTEDGLHSSVTAGENSGQVLYHAAVLRSLRRVGVAGARGGSASFTGDARVKFKSDWKRENLNIVVFVQEKKSRKILGAASTKLTA